MTRQMRSIPLLVQILLALVLVVPLAGLPGCGGDGSGNPNDGDSAAVADSSADGGDQASAADEESEDDDSSTKEAKAITVNAAAVIRGDLIVPVVAEGAIRARRSAEIRTVIEGRIVRIHVEEGGAVRKGQILATLDDREYQVALEESRSEYLQALGRLAADDETIDPVQVTDRLKAQVEELDRLEAARTITHAERVERQLALEVEAVKQGAYRGDLVQVRSGLAAARAAQERAKLDLEHTEIRAPFAGVISKLTVTAGEQVSNNQMLCQITDNVNLEAEVAVLESDLSGLVPGRPARLEIPALGDFLDVTVDVMSPEIDPGSRTCTVLLRFENPEGRFRPGMYVRASIAGQIFPERLMVPREAILTRDGRPLLFKIVDKTRAEWVYIQPGLANDRMVEIEKVLQGGPLDPGTLVVVSDHLTLTHQAKVKVGKIEKPELALASPATEN